jgi:pimeloyl-ACP methyl ester carboxylesterase
VFLHEGLGSLGLWRDVPTAIAERTGCGVLAYSRYGNGFSEPLDGARDPQYMHREALLVLPELLERYELESPLLVGHSDGASIALIYAGAHPSRVAGLVLEAPHVFVEDISVHSIAAIGDTFRTSDLRDRMTKYHADVDRTFWGWNDIWLNPDFRAWNIEESLNTIAAPILCIQGVDDEYGTLAQIDAIAAAAAGTVDRLILARCGHSPHRDRPELVVDVIAGWIASTADALDNARRTANRSEIR